MSELKLDPKCFYHDFPMTITNTGYLLPCCYWDENEFYGDPKFQELLNASKIDEHETLEEIIYSKEWKEFEENLRNHKGLTGCIRNCKITNGTRDPVRQNIWMNTENNTVKKIEE